MFHCGETSGPFIFDYMKDQICDSNGFDIAYLKQTCDASGPQKTLSDIGKSFRVEIHKDGHIIYSDELVLQKYDQDIARVCPGIYLDNPAYMFLIYCKPGLGG